MLLKKGLLTTSSSGGGGSFKGEWNALTNTPTLPSVPTFPTFKEDDYYQVSVGGTQFGITFQAEDLIVAVRNGSALAWAKRSGGGLVDSVFGRVGNVTAQNGDYNASQVTSSSFSGISANNVQSALEQIYSAIPNVSGFVPYTGANSNLDLGSNSLITPRINGVNRSLNYSLGVIPSGNEGRYRFLAEANGQQIPIVSIAANFADNNPSTTVINPNTLNDEPNSAVQYIFGSPSYNMAETKYILNADTSGEAIYSVYDNTQTLKEVLRLKANQSSIFSGSLTATGIYSTNGIFQSTVNTGTFYTPTAPNNEVGFTFQNATTVFSQLVCNQWSDPSAPGNTEFRFFAPKNNEGAVVEGSSVDLVAGIFAGNNLGRQRYEVDSSSPKYTAGLFNEGGSVLPYLSASFVGSEVVVNLPAKTTAETAPFGTNTDQLATTAFVQTALASFVVTVAEIPTGDKDGTNREFDISKTPLANTLLFFKAGQALTEGIDYTITGKKITLSSERSAPIETTNLLAYYSYNSSTPVTPSISKIEIPAGIKNGENTVFTVDFPILPNTSILFKAGQALTENIDYTSSGVNITILRAPIAADNLLIKYNHL